MKKILTSFLLVTIILSYIIVFLGVPIYANDSADDVPEIVKNAASYTCVYDGTSDTIVISGTMNYDMVVKYKNYSIKIYKISMSERVEDVIKREDQPVAVSTMSIKFTFNIKVAETADKFAKYAVVIVSPEGECFVAGTPKHINITELESVSRISALNYKGIKAENGVAAFDVNAGTVIIPVYLNKVLSGVSKGYVYQDNYKQLYFDKSYIDALDVGIKSVTATGGRVYLQFLLPADAQTLGFDPNVSANVKYLMPNIENKDVLNLLDALMLFIIDRYDGIETGTVDGIIVGKSVDCSEIYNFCGNISYDNYIELYASYVMALAISARMANSNIDLMIPISADKLYSETSTNESSFVGSNFLESVMERFDELLPSDFDFNILVENSEIPVELVYDEEEGKYEIIKDISYPNVYCASDVSQYIKTLNSKYDNAPSEYIYVWNLPEGLEGKELAFLYSYSYYSLISNEKMISFVISFENNSNFTDIKKLVTYIDERDSLIFTQQYLEAFGFLNWSDIIENFDGTGVVTHRRFQAQNVDFIPDSFSGEYVYFKVSDISDINNWSVGNYCMGLSLDYNKLSDNSLKANFTAVEAYGEYGDILYIFEHTENFIYTPYINFNVFIESMDKASSVYEIKVSLYGDTNYIETSVAVEGNNLTPIAFKIEEFSKNNAVRSIKVSVKEISDTKSSFSLYLKDIKGYSDEFSEDELEELIYNEHMKGYNQDGESEEVFSYKFIIGICFAFLGIGIGLFMFLKKD